MALTQPSRDGPTPAAAGSNPRLRSHRTLHPSAAVFHRPTALCKHPDAFLFVTAFDSILIIVQQNLPTCQEEGNRDFSVEIKAVRWYSKENRILMQLLHRPRGGRGKGQEPTSRSLGGCTFDADRSGTWDEWHVFCRNRKIMQRCCHVCGEARRFFIFSERREYP